MATTKKTTAKKATAKKPAAKKAAATAKVLNFAVMINHPFFFFQRFRFLLCFYYTGSSCTSCWENMKKM